MFASSTVTSHNNIETTPYSLQVRFLRCILKWTCLSCMSSGLESKSTCQTWKALSYILLAAKIMSKSSVIFHSSVVNTVNPILPASAQVQTLAKRHGGAPEIRRSRSVIAVTGLSSSAPFPLTHMDHLGDLFMEAIPASGPEHIQAIHASFV